MKLIVKETFEQGLPRNDGGAIKLTVGEYVAEQTKHGVVVTIEVARGGPHHRTIPAAIVTQLTARGLIELTK